MPQYSAAVIKGIACIVLAAFSVMPHRAAGQSDSLNQTRVTVFRPQLDTSARQEPSLIHVEPIKRPRIALVLSGGGARGVAAIGVLRALERSDIPIDLIVGTSMGSIVGGLYATGYSTDELQRLVDTTNWQDLLSYSDEARRSDMFLDQKIARDKSILVLRFKGLEPIIPQAFSTGQRLTNYLNILTLQGIYHPDPSFDDLRIPFRAVTTDLVTGRRIVIDRGDMTEALRASATVPLLFASVRRDTMQLLDGGLVDNMPVDVAIENKAEIIIAVDLTSPLRPKNMLNAPWEIADQITTIMMLKTKKLSLEKADVVIAPELGEHLSSDFTDLDTLIGRGEEAAEKSLRKLKALIRRRIAQTDQYDASKWFASPRFRGSAALPPEFQDSVLAYEQRDSVSALQLQTFVDDLYEEGECSRVEAEVEERKDSTLVVVHAELHPVLRDVVFKGNRVIGTDSLSSVFRPILGKHINTVAASRAVESLLALYRDAGFSLARVRDIQFDSVSGTATITLDEGVIYRNDIRGTTKTRDWVIWRELPWKEGEVFDVSKIAQGIANLYGTNLFEQILVSVHHEGKNDEFNVVTIHARERSTELIRFGLRVDNERNIQPSVDVRDENLFGAGLEAGLFLGGGTRNQSYIGELRATRIFNTYLTFGLKAYSLVRDINVYDNVPSADPYHFDRHRVGEYREMRNGGSASFGMQLQRLGSVTIEGRLEKDKIYNIYNQPFNLSNQPFVDQEYNISSIRFGTNVDTQDKVPFPTYGEVINFYYESALVKLVEAVGFTKMYFSYDKYLTFVPHHTIHPRFVVGVADDALPLGEQFSLGGQQNFFGLREDDSRGRQMLIASLEYQYKLPFSLFFDTYFKARYDFGSVWERIEAMRLQDFKHGIGVTLGFDTPIGPAEFSLGRSFYLRKDILSHPASLGPFALYFSIGYPIAGVVRN
jgi:NTE family protein